MIRMVVFDYVGRYPQAMQEIVMLIAVGKLKTRESFGKLVMKVAGSYASANANPADSRMRALN